MRSCPTAPSLTQPLTPLDVVAADRLPARQPLEVAKIKDHGIVVREEPLDHCGELHDPRRQGCLVAGELGELRLERQDLRSGEEGEPSRRDPPDCLLQDGVCLGVVLTAFQLGHGSSTRSPRHCLQRQQWRHVERDGETKLEREAEAKQEVKEAFVEPARWAQLLFFCFSFFFKFKMKHSP